MAFEIVGGYAVMSSKKSIVRMLAFIMIVLIMGGITAIPMFGIQLGPNTEAYEDVFDNNYDIYIQDSTLPSEDSFDIYEFDMEHEAEDSASSSGFHVYFHPNGGVTVPGHGTRPIGEDNRIASMPLPPGLGSLVNVVFYGWNTLPSGNGDWFTVNMELPPDEDFHVHAIWGHSISFSSDLVSLPMAGDPGNPDDYSPRVVPIGSNVASHGPSMVWPNPPAPPSAGHTFIGWFTTAGAVNDTTGTQINADTLIYANTTAYARWSTQPIHTVTFNLDGGNLTSAHVNTRQAISGSSIFDSIHLNHMLWPGTAPSVFAPTGDNRVVAGWYTQPGGGGTRFAPQGGSATQAITQFNATTPVNEDITVYPRWMYRVTFNIFHPQSSGASWPASGSTLTYGTRYVAEGSFNINNNGVNFHGQAAGMPSDPIRAGYIFAGWFTAATGGTEFLGTTTVNSTRMVYARWEPAAPDYVVLNAGLGSFPAGGRLANGSPGPDASVRIYSIGQGASFTTATGVSMPLMPTRPGYIFGGWYRDVSIPASGGNAVRNDQIPAGQNPRFTPFTLFYTGQVLHARWLPSYVVTFHPNPGSSTPGVTLQGTPPGTDGGAPTRLVPQSLYIPGTGGSFVFMHTVAGASGGPNHWWGQDPNGERFSVNARASHNFMGWNSEPDASGFRVRFTGSGIRITANLDVYAQWAPHVTFNNNHTSIASGLTNQTYMIPIMYNRSFETHHTHPNSIGTAPAQDAPNNSVPRVFPGPGTWPLGFGHAERAFLRWNTSPDGTGQDFTADSIVIEPITLYAIWSNNVVFHHGIAPLPNIEVSFTPGQALGAAWPSPNPWDGRSFMGWYNETIPGGMLVNAGSIITGPVTFTARWYVTAFFNANGGVHHPSMAYPNDRSVIVLSPPHGVGPEGMPVGGAMPTMDPTRNNWIFENEWRDAEGVLLTPTAPIIYRNRIFFAQWSSTVTFNLAGGNIAGDAASVSRPVWDDGFTPAIVGISNMPPDPVRNNYRFIGWRIQTSTHPDVGDPFAGDTVVTYGDMTVVANWEPHLVTLDPMGGTLAGGVDSPFQVTIGAPYGGNVTPEPTRTGWIFSGWNTAQDGSGTTVTASTLVANAENHTLFAQWTAVSGIMVTLNPTGGTLATGVDSPFSVTFNSPYGANVTPEPTRAGWIFGGWNTAQDGSGITVTAATLVTNAENHTLFAQWTAVSGIMVTLDPTGGTLATGVDSPFSVTFNSPYGVNVTPAPIRTGWIFDGWNTAQDGSGADVTAATLVANAENHTLFAQWVAVSGIQVTLNPAGGTLASGVDNPFSVTFNSPYGANVTSAPTRTGWIFDGWNTMQNGSGTTVTATTLVANAENHTLFAQWTAVSGIMVTLDPSGGTLAAGIDSPFPVTFNSPYGANVTPEPTRPGWTFGGWNTMQNGGGTTVTATTSVANAENHTLFAQWLRNANERQVVTFHPNGGVFTGYTQLPVRDIVRFTGYLYSQAFDADDNLVAPDLAHPTREGYYFTGWFDAASGGSIVVSTDEVTDAPTRTLYAQWRIDFTQRHTVTFDLQGGVNTGDFPPQFIINGWFATEPLAIPICDLPFDPLIGQRTFAGWFDQPTSGNSFDFANVQIFSDKTIYAQWVPPRYMVRVNVVNEAGNQISSANVVFDGVVLGFTNNRWLTTFLQPTEGLVTANASGFNPGSAAVSLSSFINNIAEVQIILRQTPGSGSGSGPGGGSGGGSDDGGTSGGGGSGGGGTPVGAPRGGGNTTLQRPSIFPQTTNDGNDEYPPLQEYFHAKFMIGYPDGHFMPNGNLTRAETAALVVRTLTTHFGVNVPRTSADITGRFKDINPNDWYFDYISIAYSYGLLQGFPDGSFRPNQPITREQFAGILARTTTILTGNTLPYIDAADVSDWAFNYVYTVLATNWMHGDLNGTFRPKSEITRAEAAAAMCRILGRGDTNARSIESVLDYVLIFPDSANPMVWYYFYVLEATNSHWFIKEDNVEIWTRVVNGLR